MEQSFWNFPLLPGPCEEESERYLPLGEVPAVDVTQRVPVSVVPTQSLLRVPEISELERAGGCPGCLQGSSQGVFFFFFFSLHILEA